MSEKKNVNKKKYDCRARHKIKKLAWMKRKRERELNSRTKLSNMREMQSQGKA